MKNKINKHPVLTLTVILLALARPSKLFNILGIQLERFPGVTVSPCGSGTTARDITAFFTGELGNSYVFGIFLRASHGQPECFESRGETVGSFTAITATVTNVYLSEAVLSNTPGATIALGSDYEGQIISSTNSLYDTVWSEVSSLSVQGAYIGLVFSSAGTPTILSYRTWIYQTLALPCHKECGSCNGPGNTDCTGCGATFPLMGSSVHSNFNGRCFCETGEIDGASDGCDNTCTGNCKSCNSASSTECFSCQVGWSLNQGANGMGDCSVPICDTSCTTCIGPGADQCTACSNPTQFKSLNRMLRQELGPAHRSHLQSCLGLDWGQEEEGLRPVTRRAPPARELGRVSVPRAKIFHLEVRSS